MPSPLFWIFALLMLIGGVAVICFRNPVSSALSMVASFVGIAGLFVGLDTYFTGIIQILVYAGAIMVLFLFIIMLLDLKDEVKRKTKIAPIAAGLVLVLAFVIQLAGVLSSTPDLQAQKLDLAKGAAYYREQKSEKIVAALDPQPREGEPLPAAKLPDVHIVGQTLFTGYNLPLQILGVLLLVATVGVVVLSKRQTT
ncbi:NADH-quinone oxidoreductase subunit J [Luteolibacter ambystomatis]|uniref:NADH-quinone oxidoreductase subunit J n=1 Tax=Luteolibacter ambystomatis TaxID=2824561 RepID=A0A975J0B2_9BACT|nr:NADH-quinone oxidoreductase subunit J [Luteolibacter ambystomatis]QUE51659.1 NADH-quinone oxidoreductase subunit J [Luteolibacter ambystomatis]